jgi:outer membrane protein TolC
MFSNMGRTSTVKRYLYIAVSALALSACSVAPDPITNAEHFDRAHEDVKALFSSYQPIQGPLTLEEAIARGLKFNYDNQLAQTEVTLQERQMDLALMQIMPRLSADAGYDWRNNDNAAESVSEETHQQSLAYSYSSPTTHRTADLQFSWNLLDAGVSYFQARQQGYRALAAVERRRKVINNLVKETRATYWKAVTAQRLLPQIDPMLADAEKALENSRAAHRDSLQPPLQALEYQQNMLQVISQLRRIRTDLSAARAQLAALINAPSSDNLVLAPQESSPSSWPRPDMKKLETLSLALRPELREEAYQEKIDRQNVYKEIVKMLPGVSLLSSINYDSNQYLSNNTWSEAGVRASYNLVNLVQGPKAIEAAEAGVDVAHVRRLALSVAVLTQVNLANQQLERSREMLDTAAAVDNVQKQISTLVNNANTVNATSDAERIRRFLNATAAELEHDRALSDVNAALGNLYAAVGIDLVPPTVDFTELDPLTKQVGQAIIDWEAGRLPPLPDDSPAKPENGDSPPQAQSQPEEPKAGEAAQGVGVVASPASPNS